MDRVEPNAGESSKSDAEPSFVELQRRIGQVPDGPSGVLETPKPYRVLNVIGGMGALVALLLHDAYPPATVRIDAGGFNG